MKISEEILLEEVKAEYTRQLTSWTELNHKSHNFLQLNGLLLSVIFIGIGIIKDSLDVFTFLLLAASSCSVIVSTLILVRFVTPAASLKEIRIDLEGDIDVKDKEKDIMWSLIRQYNISQNNIISKHEGRLKKMSYSVWSLVVGLFFLLAFIFVIFLSAAQLTLV